MAGIGTAARNWDEEKKQQGIGTPAYHEPAGSISTPAQNQSIGTPAYHEPAGSIGTPASRDGTMKPVDPMRGSTGQQPIQVMQGVTQNTQQKMQQAQQGYQPGAAAQNAMQKLQQLQQNKPQGYTSKYAPALDNILAQIQGQKDFKYEFNQDALFNSLKDVYTQQAKQASLNAQGQAAGLTGGYGNSAAQAAGSQAYQQAILPLYDKGMELAQFAFQQHQGAQDDRYRQLQALMGMDESDYGRYRDTVGDYEREREYLTGRYDTEENRAYDRYKDDLDYWTGLAQIENQDYRSEQERQEAIRQYNQDYDLRQQQFAWQQGVDQRDYDRGVLESDRNYEMQQAQMNENIRQFNESLDWDKMSSQQKYAAQYALAILEKGQMPSEELLAAAGLSAQDAQALMTKISSGGPGKPKTTTETQITPIDLMAAMNVERIKAEDQAAWNAANTVRTPAGPVNQNVQVPAYNDVAPAHAQVWNPDPTTHSYNELMEHFKERKGF